jgi:thiamine monophosphate kinase
MGIGGGGTDISDGLGVDVHDLCSTSGVGCIVDAARIPLEPETRIMGLGQNAWRFAFVSGGDFQFVVTAKKAHRAVMERLGFTAIGVTTEKRTHLLRTPDGEMKPLPVFGHRDARRLSFANETAKLLKQLNKH